MAPQGVLRVSVLVAALAASVREAHQSPYDRETGHTIWVDGVDGGFAVHCIPHGPIGTGPTHLAAMVMGYAHDEENGTVSW